MEDRLRVVEYRNHASRFLVSARTPAADQLRKNLHQGNIEGDKSLPFSEARIAASGAVPGVQP
jgi:hypothetical protein